MESGDYSSLCLRLIVLAQKKIALVTVIVKNV